MINSVITGYARYLIFRMVGSPSFVRRIEWRKMQQWLSPQRGEKILDVACGSGELSLIVAKSGCDLHGIDVSEAGVDSARRLSLRSRIPGRFIKGDAEHLQFPDAHFDKILCSSSLEHFSNDAFALEEMARVLKPGGKIVLTVDSFTYPISQRLKEKHQTMFFVARYYTPEQLEKAFHRAGLEITRSQYLLNSRLTSLFFKLWIRYRPSLPVWLLISCAGYPFFLLSDRCFGRRDAGYTLIAEATKP